MGTQSWGIHYSHTQVVALDIEITTHTIICVGASIEASSGGYRVQVVVLESPV